MEQVKYRMFNLVCALTKTGKMSDGWEHLVEKIIGMIFHLIAFGAVCKSWISVTVKMVWCPRPQLLWLMLRPQESDTVEFLSPSEGQIYTLKFLEDGCCWGAYEGWLMIDMVSNPKQNFLFNPVSGSRIRIPPRLTFPSGQICQSYVHVATLSSIPTVARDFVIVGINTSGKLAICRPRDVNWFVLEGGAEDETFYVAIVFCNGNLYALDDQLQLWHGIRTMGNLPHKLVKLDVRTPRVRKPEKFIFNPTVYLVERDRKLLLVSRVWSDEKDHSNFCSRVWSDEKSHSNFCRETQGFQVLELNDSISRWDLVDRMHGYILVLGTDYAKSISARNVLGATANQIYFTDKTFCNFWSAFNGWSSSYTTLKVYNHVNWDIQPYVVSEGPEGDLPFHYPSIWLIPTLEQAPQRRKPLSIRSSPLRGLLRCFP